MKKSTLAILGIVVIVGIAAVALVMMSNAENEKITYNYETKEASSFNYTISGYTYTETPSAGNKYIIAHIVVKNESYSKGFTPSLGIFKLKCSNNNSYSYDIDTIYYSSKSSSLYDLTLGTGSSYDFYIVYEVPIGTTATGMDIAYTYSPYSLISMDGSLSIPTWVYPS